MFDSSMNQKATFLLVCISFIFLGLNAQKGVDAGIKAYESGKYTLAVNELNTALEGAAKMKEKALAEAYYYRGQAKTTYLTKLIANDNLGDNIEKLAPDYAITGLEDLQLAKKNDVAEKWVPQIKHALRKMERNVLDIAQLTLNEAVGNEDAEGQKQQYERVIALADAAIAYDKRHYVPYNMKAQALYATGDKAGALKNWHLADDVFFRRSPKNGDLSVAYIYIHIAELEKELNNNSTEAKKAIEEGMERLEGEQKKMQRFGQQSAAEKANLEIKYEEIRKEIEATKAKL